MIMQLCQPGYHWDFTANACVPDAPMQGQQMPQGMPQGMPQQQGGGIDPTQLLQMYKQFGGLGGGASTGGEMAAVGPKLDSAIASNPDIFGSSGGSGGGAMSGAAAYWPAAVIAAALGLQHNNVSSIPHQIMGKGGTDILHSPNVKNHVPGTILNMLRPLTTAADVSRWGQLPGDMWKATKAPLNWLKGIF